jgi:hypothetical protein
MDRQNRQFGQQSQQRDQWDQDSQRTSESRWQEDRFQSGRQSSRFPQPSRGQFGSQQYSETQQYGRGDSQQYGGQYGQQGEYGQQYGGTYSQRQWSQGGDEEDAGLGVNIQADGDQGVTVVRVFPNTPAEEMGLEEGDRITEVNGQQVQSVQNFISRIRSMEPGQEVELSVNRDQEQYTISGQLESREEALARTQQGGQSWQQGGQQSWQQDETWQTGYQEGGSQQGGSQPGRVARLQQIEQRVDQLRRELDQLRATLQDLRQGGQYGRSGERQAGYDEYQGSYGQQQRYGTRQRTIDGQWSDQPQGRSRIIDDQGFRGTSQGRFDDGSFQSEGRGGFRSSNEAGQDSPGGVTGGLRTRPDNDPNWER